MINIIRFFFQYLKQRQDIYSDKIQRDFQPLEYIEIKQKKKLIIKLNDDWAFSCNLDNFYDFIKFNAVKTQAIGSIEKLNDLDDSANVTGLKIANYRLLITMLYEISKNHFIHKYPKTTNKVREKYRAFLEEYLIDQNNMVQVFTKVLRYNTELKKKLQVLMNFQIFNSDASMTIGGRQLSDYIKIDPQTGEKSFDPYLF